MVMLQADALLTSFEMGVAGRKNDPAIGAVIVWQQCSLDLRLLMPEIGLLAPLYCSV